MPLCALPSDYPQSTLPSTVSSFSLQKLIQPFKGELAYVQGKAMVTAQAWRLEVPRTVPFLKALCFL